MAEQWAIVCWIVNERVGSARLRTRNIGAYRTNSPGEEAHTSRRIACERALGENVAGDDRERGRLERAG